MDPRNVDVLQLFVEDSLKFVFLSTQLSFYDPDGTRLASEVLQKGKQIRSRIVCRPIVVPFQFTDIRSSRKLQLIVLEGCPHRLSRGLQCWYCTRKLDSETGEYHEALTTICTAQN